MIPLDKKRGVGGVRIGPPQDWQADVPWTTAVMGNSRFSPCIQSYGSSFSISTLRPSTCTNKSVIQAIIIIIVPYLQFFDQKISALNEKNMSGKFRRPGTVVPTSDVCLLLREKESLMRKVIPHQTLHFTPDGHQIGCPSVLFYLFFEPMVNNV